MRIKTGEELKKKQFFATTMVILLLLSTWTTLVIRPTAAVYVDHITEIFHPTSGVDKVSCPYTMTEDDLDKVSESNDEYYQSKHQWPKCYSPEKYIQWNFSSNILSNTIINSVFLVFEWKRSNNVEKDSSINVWIENQNLWTENYTITATQGNTDYSVELNLSDIIDTVENVNSFKIWFHALGRWCSKTYHDLVQLNVTYEFAEEYDLTIDSTSGGIVSNPGEGTFTYTEGTVVDLVASPNVGYHFVNWTGDISQVYDVDDPVTNITMLGDYEITANFAIDTHDLTIGSSSGGSVTTPGEGTFTYDYGAVINLVASPNVGYHFVNWTGDISQVYDVDDPVTNITMLGDYEITAEFHEGDPPKKFDLTIDSTSGGIVSNPGEGTFTYTEGTVVDLVAEAEEGYTFVEWTGDIGSIAEIYNNETKITINGGYSVTAFFIPDDIKQIFDWYDLDDIRNYPNKNYLLMMDLNSNVAGYDDLAGPLANEGKGWLPIGNNSSRFQGTFDGRGNTITGLYSKRPNSDYNGLFGYTNETSTIKEVGLVNVDITGKDTVGGLVGNNFGIILDSYVSGNINGNDLVGGLAGSNTGHISNSYSTGNVAGVNQVGGLVGYNSGVLFQTPMQVER